MGFTIGTIADLAPNGRLVVFGQMIDYIADFVNLAALDQCALAGEFVYRGVECLAASRTYKRGT